MKRRHLLGLAGIAVGATASLAHAQKSAMPRVGFLIAGDPEPVWTLFRKAMTDLGYVEDRTVKYEFRSSDATSGRLDELAAALVGLEVDVIVACLTPAVVAAKKATSKIPIVFNGGAPDTGLVTNLARPEGNLTGVFSPGTTLAGKAVQLFVEIKPQTKSFGVLLNARDPFHVPLLRDIETVARAQKIDLVPILLESRDGIGQSIEAMARQGVDGVLIQPTLGLEAVAPLALKHRLPAISFRREFAEAGGLMSYGADQAELNRLLVGQVARVLKGVSPANIPVQQATRFELVVNQKTAKALGLVLSPMLLARADEVIE
jgi:putative ABC transport system substrate-binding protein